MSSETPNLWLPPFTTVPLLTPDECANIVRRCDRLNMQPATRVSDESPDQFIVDEDYRVALTCKTVPGEAIYELVLRKVLASLPAINTSYNFDLYEEPHQLLPAVMLNRYDAGEKPGHHAWHTDTGSLPFSQHRKLSIVVTLSPPDSHAGGQFQILDGSTHFPLEGCPEGTGAIFPGFALHRVMPMLDSTRYSCVLWLMGPRFR